MSVRTYDPKPRDIFPPALCTAGCGKPYHSICRGCNLAYCADHLKSFHSCETYPARQNVPSPPPRPVVDLAEEAFLDAYAGVIVKAKELLVQANHTRGESADWPAGSKWEELAGTSKSIFMHKAREALGIDHESFLMIVRAWPYSDAGAEELEQLFGS